MGDFYLGQLMLWAGNFAPQGWLECNGQLLPIADYDTLYVILGTTYGGDGQTTFALPDLRGRVVNGVGQGPGLPNTTLGMVLGKETNTITSAQMPIHTHTGTGTIYEACSSLDTKDSATPVDCFPAQTLGTNSYATTTNALMGVSQLGNIALSASGGGAPMDNFMPTLAMYYCICTVGIFPSQP